MSDAAVIGVIVTFGSAAFAAMLWWLTEIMRDDEKREDFLRTYDAGLAHLVRYNDSGMPFEAGVGVAARDPYEHVMPPWRGKRMPCPRHPHAEDEHQVTISRLCDLLDRSLDEEDRDERRERCHPG